MSRVPDDSTRAFYDDLAADYHLIFPDWDASMARQGAALDRLITEALGVGGHRVLDCACGIGTQSIALARLGRRVIGTDLSAVAVRRAAVEAAARGALFSAAVADMRQLPFPNASFDVIVSADNSIAHLLTPGNLRRALAEMRRVLRPGGLLLLSVRSELGRQTHPTSTPVQVSRTPTGRVITFQLWDWHPDGEHYDMEHIQLHPSADGYSVRVRRATSWAMARAELTGHLNQTGWQSVAWHEPEDSGFFQPIVVARPATPDAS
jgi:SAM-dependent methyltransferase